MTFAIGWPQALEMFFAKRCNVFIARKTFMKEYLIGTGRTMKDIEPITSLAKYFEAPDFHFAISKATNPRYVRMLSEALTKAKASPDYDKLVAKWYRLDASDLTKLKPDTCVKKGLGVESCHRVCTAGCPRIT